MKGALAVFLAGLALLSGCAVEAASADEMSASSADRLTATEASSLVVPTDPAQPPASVRAARPAFHTSNNASGPQPNPWHDGTGDPDPWNVVSPDDANGGSGPKNVNTER